MESLTNSASSQELRKTCDHCRRRKIKCSNQNPCTRCQRFGLLCQYSPTRPIGRPSKQQVTPPSDSSSASCQQSSDSFNWNELARTGDLEIPGNLAEAMTLGTLGAPMTFPTTPDELSWPEWSALDTIINTIHPLDSSYPDQSLQTREESHATDNGNGADVGLQSQQGTNSNAQCRCGELVRMHMNNKKADVDDLSEFIVAQRKSKDLALQVLSCTGCGSLDSSPSQIQGNVLLFGAIMMDTLSSYQSFVRNQKQCALTSPDERCTTQLYLASQNPSCPNIEFQLERQHAWPLAKVLLRIDIDHLSRVCITFVNRQWRVHERGHETCSATTCKKDKFTKVSIPADFCPRSVEPTIFFNCFRTAKHLQSLIEGVRKDLE